MMMLYKSLNILYLFTFCADINFELLGVEVEF